MYVFNLHKAAGVSGRFKGRFRALAGFCLAAALAPSLLFGLPGQGHAGDMEYIETEGVAPEQQDGSFVRIGLNKSAVIRLPADAKDVIVGNPDVVDVVVRTRNTAYLFARKVGQTNVFFFDQKGQQILNVDLEVALDMTALQQLLKRRLPNSNIAVDTIDNSVVLGGTASNAAEAKIAEDIAAKFVGTGDEGTGVVNAITLLGTDQVMLKVRMVEVQRDVLKQFGVNLQAMLEAGNFALNLTSAGQFTSPTGLLDTRNSIGLGFDDGTNSVEGILRAMERDGVLRTLAEPTLVAVSGQTANFSAGGEFPVPQRIEGTDDGTATNVTYTFRSFGVGLGFTPTVMSDGRINLAIKTEVSELANEGAISKAQHVLPAIKKRTAETVIELPSGGSMMLAGLIKDQMRQTIDGTPGLKDLPVLGTLFRSRNYIQNQTELVVLVTPYLVNPVHEKNLATPDKGFNVATDRQSVLFGRLHKVYGTPGQNPDGVYHGNVGYIIE